MRRDEFEEIKPDPEGISKFAQVWLVIKAVGRRDDVMDDITTALLKRAPKSLKSIGVQEVGITSTDTVYWMLLLRSTDTSQITAASLRSVIKTLDLQSAHFGYLRTMKPGVDMQAVYPPDTQVAGSKRRGANPRNCDVKVIKRMKADGEKLTIGELGVLVEHYEQQSALQDEGGIPMTVRRERNSRPYRVYDVWARKYEFEMLLRAAELKAASSDVQRKDIIDNCWYQAHKHLVHSEHLQWSKYFGELYKGKGEPDAASHKGAAVARRHVIENFWKTHEHFTLSYFKRCQEHYGYEYGLGRLECDIELTEEMYANELELNKACKVREETALKNYLEWSALMKRAYFGTEALQRF